MITASVALGALADGISRGNDLESFSILQTKGRAAHEKLQGDHSKAIA